MKKTQLAQGPIRGLDRGGAAEGKDSDRPADQSETGVERATQPTTSSQDGVRGSCDPTE